MPRLTTPRLLLRPIEAADIEPLARLWTDPLVTRYMGGPRDYAQLLLNFNQELTAAPEIYDLWPVLERETNRLIGHCGLLDKEVEGMMEVELVYVFHPSAWGRGFAIEIGLALQAYAFTTLGLSRLIALINPANAASARVAQALGMRFEKAVQRNYLLHIYAISAP